MKILLVEDSNLLRRSMASVVKDNGYEAIEAPNGAEALERLSEHAADTVMVILDWNMPVMDGYEALQEIRACADYQEIRILMATSDGSDEDIAKAVRAGADGYLVKPFSKEDLSNKISELLADQLDQKATNIEGPL
jgi:two-component system chemotaxis response regulator CheY